MMAVGIIASLALAFIAGVGVGRRWPLGERYKSQDRGGSADPPNE